MPWMEANGVALRYELSGDGPETLILVHELGRCIGKLERRPANAGEGILILRYDQRGFGLSGKRRARSTYRS